MVICVTFWKGIKDKEERSKENGGKVEHCLFLGQRRVTLQQVRRTLGQKDGIEINFTYSNAKWCSEMVSAIGKVFKDQHTKKATETNYISAMADGASDVGRVEKETVYFHFLCDGRPVNCLVGHIALSI